MIERTEVIATDRLCSCCLDRGIQTHLLLFRTNGRDPERRYPVLPATLRRTREISVKTLVCPWCDGTTEEGLDAR